MRKAHACCIRISYHLDSIRHTSPPTYTASNCSEAEAQRDAALSHVSARLAASTLGAAGLRQKLLRLDMTGSGAVRSDEVQLAFAFVGVQLERDEMEAIEARFGTPQPQVVDVRGLLGYLDARQQ